MKAWMRIVIAAMAFIGMCAIPLRGQQEGDGKPKPAARVLLPLPDVNGDQQDSADDNQTLQPDHGPVSGVQNGTLGTSELRHSYWVTGAQYSNIVQTNSVSTTNTSQWMTTNYASGNLSLLEAWSHLLVGANYTGGGFFSSAADQGNGQFHQLSSAIEIDQRRWQALVLEQFSYLPQSSFGFGGTTGLAVPGITGALAAPLPGLQEMFVPGQSIFSVVGPRYSSASAAQLTYAASRRGAFTGAVIYGLLRFSDSGNISNDSEILSLAYTYSITRKDTVGAIYRFTAYHYPGDPQALGDQAFQLMYARRVTGRIALNLAGGPDVTNFRIPVGGTKQSMSGGGSAALSYEFAKSSIRLSYSHGIGSGSGLFSGSNADQLTLNLNRRLGPGWECILSSGYARNSTIVTIKGLSSPSYNSLLEGVGLSRPLGRSARFAIGYQAQIQASNGVFCTTAGCQTNQVGHQIQMSLQWNAPPQVLR